MKGFIGDFRTYLWLGVPSACLKYPVVTNHMPKPTGTVGWKRFKGRSKAKRRYSLASSKCVPAIVKVSWTPNHFPWTHTDVSEYLAKPASIGSEKDLASPKCYILSLLKPRLPSKSEARFQSKVWQRAHICVLVVPVRWRYEKKISIPAVLYIDTSLLRCDVDQHTIVCRFDAT